MLLCLGAVCVLLQEQLEDVQAADRSGDTLHREAPAAPGRWPTFPRETGSRPHRLLIATHARLLWFNYRTHEAQVLHEGEVCPSAAGPPRPPREEQMIPPTRSDPTPPDATAPHDATLSLTAAPPSVGNILWSLPRA